MPGDAHYLALLTRYTAWANACVYRALDGLPATQLAAPTPIFAGSILRTLNHVRLIGVVWQAHLLGVPHGFTVRNPETAPPLDDLRAAQRTLDAWYVDYADTLTDTQAGEAVAFTFIGGGEGSMTRGEIIAHVVNHTTYHRGHITAMLWTLGARPPTTDLPVFLREAGGHRAGFRAGAVNHESSNSSCCASKLSRSTKLDTPTPTSR